MEKNAHEASSVITDSAPIKKSRLGIMPSNTLARSPTGASKLPGKFTRLKPVKLEDVRSNGFLEAMIASSPPRKKLVKDLNVEVASDDIDLAYTSWMVCLIFLSVFSTFFVVFLFFNFC